MGDAGKVREQDTEGATSPPGSGMEDGDDEDGSASEGAREVVEVGADGDRDGEEDDLALKVRTVLFENITWPIDEYALVLLCVCIAQA